MAESTLKKKFCKHLMNIMNKLLTTKIHIVYDLNWIVDKSKNYASCLCCTESVFLCCCIKIANLTEKAWVWCRSGCCKKWTEKYRLYRFAGMCPEWLCGAFWKIKTRNLEIRTSAKRKAPLAWCSGLLFDADCVAFGFQLSLVLIIRIPGKSSQLHTLAVVQRSAEILTVLHNNRFCWCFFLDRKFNASLTAYLFTVQTCGLNAFTGALV